ncbi:hdeD, partial [Gluconobacter japonicus]
LGGLLLIEEPATGSVFITAILAGCLIFAGISRAFWAAGHRTAGGWSLLAVSGIFTLLIGILLYMTLPWSGLWLIGTLIAIELLMAGISAILFGMSLRNRA